MQPKEFQAQLCPPGRRAPELLWCSRAKGKAWPPQGSSHVPGTVPAPACDPVVPPKLLEGKELYFHFTDEKTVTPAGSKFVKHQWNIDSGTRISIQVGLDSKTLDAPTILFYTLGKQCFRIYIRHFQGHWPILAFSVVIRQWGSDSIHFSFYLPPFLPIFLFKYPFL